MEDFHHSKGRIIYDPYRGQMKNRTQWWCIVDVDKEITRYYRHLVNKNVLNPLDLPTMSLYEPAWNAHASACRGEYIAPELTHLWKKYHNQIVEFDYSNYVFQPLNNPNFWCIVVKCPMIDVIRAELGLKTFYSYHITVGRTYKEFSQSTSL